MVTYRKEGVTNYNRLYPAWGIIIQESLLLHRPEVTKPMAILSIQLSVRTGPQPKQLDGDDDRLKAPRKVFLLQLPHFIIERRSLPPHASWGRWSREKMGLPRGTIPRHDGSLGQPLQPSMSVKYLRRFAGPRPSSKGTGSSLASTYDAQSRGIITTAQGLLFNQHIE